MYLQPKALISSDKMASISIILGFISDGESVFQNLSNLSPTNLWKFLSFSVQDQSLSQDQ